MNDVVVSPDRRALLESMAVGWEAAAATAASAGTLHRRDVTIAGVPVRLELAGDALAATVLPGLEIHPPTDLTPLVRLEAYDATATGAPMPLDVAAATMATLPGRGDVLSWQAGGEGRPAGQWHPRTRDGQVFVHVDGGPDRYAIIDAVRSPWWELGCPLRQSLAWALGPLGAVFLHAAAVGRPDGAILLVGAGGSGKSSTALSSLVGGLHFLGDDYCVLTNPAGTDGPPLVHALYGVAKVAPDQLDEVDPEGVLRPHVIRAGSTSEDRDERNAAKAVVAVSRWDGGRFLDHAPIRAVVVPDRTAPPGVSRVGGAEALRHLAPTSLFQLRGVGPDALREQADLVRRVPCFRLGLLPHRAANAPVLEQLLVDLGVDSDPSRRGVG